MRSVVFLLLISLSLLPRGVLAASDWVLELKNDGSTAPSGGLRESTNQLASGQVLSIRCESSRDCRQVQVVQSNLAGPTVLTPSMAATEQAATFALRHELATGQNSSLVVMNGTAQLFRAPIVAAAMASPRSPKARGEDAPAAPVATTTVPIAELLATHCPKKTFHITPYDEASDRAHVVITPRGTVLSGIPTKFDEDDSLVVTVYGDLRLLPLLQVKRKSGFRVSGGVNILGGSVSVPAELDTQSLGDEEALVCGAQDFTLSDFAAGRGEVDVHVLMHARRHVDPLAIGGFDFSVHTKRWSEPLRPSGPFTRQASSGVPR